MERKKEDVDNRSKQVPSSSAETLANIEDILKEILLRVPSLTLARFKCVSKHWLSLISNPSFSSSHAKRVDNKSLYICAVEEYGDWFSRYRVQAIKFSHLFSFSDINTPITIYPAGSKSNFNSSVLQEVALLEGGGGDVPYAMGSCVFRSQITLTGGFFLNPQPKIYDAPKPCYVLDTTASDPRFVISSMIPPMKIDRAYVPWMQEIDGKLYVLSDDFGVFDPETEEWKFLARCQGGSISCAVFGSQIYATNTFSGSTYCFDVSPSSSFQWSPVGHFFQYKGAGPYHNNTLVVDTEEDNCEKLIFTFDRFNIQVHRINLRHRRPTVYELVASIDLPLIPSLLKRDVMSYSSAHLGDQKVCFSALYYNGANARSLLVLPFEYAYSNSGVDVRFSSTTDQSSLMCTTFCGSFAAKALGYHLFNYDYAEDGSDFKTGHLGGCFVL